MKARHSAPTYLGMASATHALLASSSLSLSSSSSSSSSSWALSPSFQIATPTRRLSRARCDEYRAASYCSRLEMSSAANTEEETKEGWNIGAVTESVEESERKRTMAKEALTKLLAKQQRDVQQTLDLIEQLDLQESDQESDQEMDQESGELEGIAASILCGADYGFVSRSEGCRMEALDEEYLTDTRFGGYGPPGNVFRVGAQQFRRNLAAMFDEYVDEKGKAALTARQEELQAQLSELRLDSQAIWARERARGEVSAPWVVLGPYYVLCSALDWVFEGRSAISRFFLLETVARMPYFSYMTMLQVYETVGFWRRSADVKRIHFAEEWNEFHHLLIMESLGGDQPYWVRFLAQHSALAYYLALCLLWLLSPSLSYKFSELLETHAVDTYSQFLDENERRLKALPPPLAALDYYALGLSDPLFGEYQTASTADPDRPLRRPGTHMRTLYDVFAAIRADEADHVSTMQSCLDPKAPVLSAGLETRLLTGVALTASLGYLIGTAATSSGLFDSLLADTPDLDSLISESADSPGFFEPLFDALVGGAVGLANGLAEAFRDTGSTVAEVNEEATTTVIEDVVGGGLTEGAEIQTALELFKKLAIQIFELIGLGA